jgi:hypothetical protein
MKESPMRLIKCCAEFRPKDLVKEVPNGRRGFYVLYQLKGKDRYDVVYVGMARRNMRVRLIKHLKSARKRDLWTHFSVFEVWNNIRNEEIVELEGLFRHLYRDDSRASALNEQRTFSKVEKLCRDDFAKWPN